MMLITSSLLFRLQHTPRILDSLVFIVVDRSKRKEVIIPSSMGSLMAGWDSPVHGDSTKARRMRNRSLTKEEVEAFWRQQGKPAPVDVGGDASSPLASPGRTMEKSPLGSSKQRSGSPVTPGHEEEVDTGDADAAGESAGKSRDWWTRSNWAFLNEPPQEMAPGTAHSYTPQFHVAGGGGRIAAEDA